MSSQTLARKRTKGYVNNSTLILLAFGTVFFSRVLSGIGAPSTINFLHFATVPFVCWTAVVKSRTKDRNQIFISYAILAGLLFFLAAITASGILNQAGIVNVILQFLMLVEPFLLLLAIVCIPMSQQSTQKIKTWIIRFAFVNLFFAFIQGGVLRLQRFNPDWVKGVFLKQGAGHVIGASVSLTFGLYYLVSAKNVPLWLRIAVVIATFWHMLVADAKQVLLVFLLAWILLLVTKLKDIGEIVKYAVLITIFYYGFMWCLQNVPEFDGFNTWLRPDIYGSDGEATKLKLAGFRIIPTFYHSPLNWLFGLGPGHTIGRLGGWMLLEYDDLLLPLGATVHPASGAVWAAVGASWLGDKSSMFSPLFSWAGIWGDLGWLGLGAYSYFWVLIWWKLCLDDLTRFYVLTVFVFGLVFSQLEEPAYMLFVTLIIGLRWQEHQTGLDS